ncbi:MAG: hypothetical protein U0836_11045 [Pirellulales bacterium]
MLKASACLAPLLTLTLSAAGFAQTLDEAKLDQFLDRLAEKNQAMGSLVIARDGQVLYSRAVGDGGTLMVQPGSEDAAAVEATADDKFQVFRGIVTFEFDAAKNQMILNRGPVRRVFTKEE